MRCFHLRKSSRDDEVVTLAKSLIKTWKKSLPENAEKQKEKKSGDNDRGGGGGGGGDSNNGKNGHNSNNDADSRRREELKSFPTK